MYGHRQYRHISESSTATNNSREAANDELYDESRQYKPKAECDNFAATTVRHNTGYGGNSSLQPRASHAAHRELKEIFEKPKAKLEERKKRLENGLERIIPNNSRSVTRNEEMVSSYQNVDHNIYCGAQAVKRSPAFSNASEVCTDSSDVHTNSLTRVNPYNKPNCSTGSSCFKSDHTHPKHIHQKGEVQQQYECHENHLTPSKQRLNSDEKETECNTSCACNTVPGTGRVNPDRNSKTMTELRNDQCSNCENRKEAFEERHKALKARDEIIHDYQLHEMICHKAIKQKLDEDYAEIQKLRKNYSSLRKLFLALAILNIILILCVVSVLPVILVTFKLSNEGESPSDDGTSRLSARYLSSTEAKDIVKEHIFCVKCERIKDSWSDIFTREAHKGCCLQDVASLVERVISFDEKNFKESDTRILEKIKHDNRRYDAAIYKLQNVVFNASFNGSVEGAILGSQHEKNSKLINTLLARKRSAVHLSGEIMHRHIEWAQDFPKGQSKNRHKLRHHKNMIKVESGGVYFVYSCIHFDAGLCNTKQTIGYKILIGHAGNELPIASVQHSCVNGTNTETDLTSQQVVHIPVDQKNDIGSTLRIKIDSEHGLISKTHRHSFGLFEI